MTCAFIPIMMFLLKSRLKYKYPLNGERGPPKNKVELIPFDEKFEENFILNLEYQVFLNCI